jgi:hypothetical protein
VINDNSLVVIACAQPQLSLAIKYEDLPILDGQAVIKAFRIPGLCHAVTLELTLGVRPAHMQTGAPKYCRIRLRVLQIAKLHCLYSL